jgi:hypothetical protein
MTDDTLAILRILIFVSSVNLWKLGDFGAFRAFLAIGNPAFFIKSYGVVWAIHRPPYEQQIREMY